MSCNLGEVICQYRLSKKMTQDEFASRLGVTPQAVSKWERGNGLPDVSLIEGICSVLESCYSSLSVGCADCDIQMYNAIGFSIPLGDMLAFETKGK